MLPLRIALMFLIAYKCFVMEGLANSSDQGYLTEYCRHIIALKESRNPADWTTAYTAVDTDKSTFKQGKYIIERKSKGEEKDKGKGKGKENIEGFCAKCVDTKKTTNFELPKDCSSIYESGITKSGIYSIYFKPAWMTKIEAKVYCDMESAGGGWTVFQRRGDFGTPHINFTRNWYNYSIGFGNLIEEFWLGNENIHRLTKQDNMTLRVELKDFEGNFRYANYDTFSVGGFKDDYILEVGKYNGDAGDSLSYHNGRKFVTFDYNNQFKCADIHKGGWWYNRCISSNLNGLYVGNQINFAGINWFEWRKNHYSFKWTEMKLRPKQFK